MGLLEDLLPIRRILVDGAPLAFARDLNIDSDTLTATLSADGSTVSLSAIGGGGGSTEDTAATPDTLALRDSFGNCAFVGLTAATLTGSTTLAVECSGALTIATLSSSLVAGRSTSPTSIVGSSLTCDADTITKRTSSGSSRCVETVAAAFTCVYAAAVTSITDSWTQASSGAGGSRTRSGQRGASGSAGGDIIENVGDGGTTGTNSPGNYRIDLGTRVTSGTTGKFRLTRSAGANVLCSWYNQELANYNIWNMEGQNLQILMSSNILETSCQSMSFVSTLGGQVDISGSVIATCTFLEVSGQQSSDTNDVAFAVSITLNNNLSNHHRIGALTANITTLDMSNLRDGAVYTVHVTQDGTGTRTIAWAAKFIFGANYSNVPEPTAGDWTIWTFLCDGTNLRCIGKESS